MRLLAITRYQGTDGSQPYITFQGICNIYLINNKEVNPLESTDGRN